MRQDRQYKDIPADNSLVNSMHYAKIQGMHKLWQALKEYVDVFYVCEDGKVEEVEVFFKQDEDPTDVYSVRMNSYLACCLDTARAIQRIVEKLL